MRKTLFIVSTLGMGGLEKVNAILANSLAATIYCLRPYVIDNFFKVNHLINHQSTCMERIIGFVLWQAPIINPYTFKVKQIIETIKFHQFEAIILSEETILLAPLIKNKMPQLKIINWIHSDYNFYFNDYLRKTARFLDSALKKADFNVCMTHGYAEKYSVHSSQGKTICIYNPLTITNKNLKCNLDSKNIIWTGRLENKPKGLDILVKVANRLPEGWQIVVAGDGPDRRMIENHPRIKILGSLKGEELSTHYASGSIFLQTSNYEGFSLVLGEAMSFGLPVVSTNHAGAIELLGDDEYGLVGKIKDADSLLELINRLIADNNLLQYYSNQSLQRVRDLNINQICEMWQEILN